MRDESAWVRMEKEFEKGPALDPLIALRFRTVVSGKEMHTVLEVFKDEADAAISSYKAYGWELVAYIYLSLGTPPTERVVGVIEA